MSSLLTRFKDRIYNKAIAYYNGELYQHTQAGWQQNAEKSQLKVLIVSPSFYTQTVKKYPVTDKRELKKLLKLQQTPNQFYLIKSQDDQSIHVIHWQFDEQLPKAWLYLPESLLLAQHTQPDHVLEVQENKHSCYFFANQQHTLFLAQKSPLMNNVERFAISTGIQCEHSQYLSFEQKLGVVKQAISKLKPKHWLAFMPQPQQLDWWPIAFKSVIPATVVVILYSIISSAYLYTMNLHYNNQLNDQRSNLSQLLDLQQGIDNRQEAINQLQAFLVDKPYYLPLWLELAPLFEQVDLDSIRINNGRIMLRGEAKQATAIMEMLSNSANVKDAKFDSPVSKSRRGERFNMSFTFNDTLTLENKFSATSTEEGQNNE